MKKIYIIFILLNGLLNHIMAQDVHFSQFFNAAALNNPAQAGQYRLVHKAQVNFRNQWSTIPAPYSTALLQYDASLFNCKLRGDHMGANLSFLNDKSGPSLNTFQTKLAIAYHKALDKKLQHHLSVGFQGDFTNKSIDFSKLFDQSQIGDPTRPSIEPGRSSSFSYVDLNAGLLWTSYFGEQSSFYIGGAIHHLTQPNETFYSSGKRLGMRSVGHAAAQMLIGDHLTIAPAFMYQTQSGASEILFGNAFGYSFKQSYGKTNFASFYLGLWYRLQDAFIVFTGVDYRNIRFSFSYDINASSLRTASASQGGFELTLAYIAFKKGCKRKHQGVSCPRF